MSMKNIFNGVARLYEEVRPGYPEELIEDVIRISGIPEEGRILEVGCGTGQATIPFARRGYEMLCLDIGKELVKIARKKSKLYPKVDIRNVSFEEWTPEVGSFDLLISATAFHWIPPEIGYPKAAQILKETGCIALFWNMHPTPYTRFFNDVQRVYRSVVPEWRDIRDNPPVEEKIREREAVIEGSGLFENVEVRTYPWSRVFTKKQYLKLLDTFSDHRNLKALRRRELYDGISKVIEEEYGGVITRPYLSVLYVAARA
jgi:SAM-dependent methyltransferase